MSDVKPCNFHLESESDALEVIPPPEAFQRTLHCADFEEYQKLYRKSLEQPGVFWTEIAQQFFWEKSCEGKSLEYNFDIRKGAIFTRFMAGARTNICYNALDRNIKQGLGDKIAFYWEGNDPGDQTSVTYKQLLVQVCKFANVLKAKGVRKGDRVSVYLPMILELPVVMLACARIGAVHSVVFGGFSAEAVAMRLMDAGAEVLVTADGVWRGNKLINLKEIADEAIAICSKNGHPVKHSIVVRHLLPAQASALCQNGVHAPEKSGAGDQSVAGKRPCSQLKVNWNATVDAWYADLMAEASDECSVEFVDAEDNLFMLYTSGSTGKPKGVLHTTGGYMVYAATTFKYVFNYLPDDVYFCTADIGWITGHSYVVYGPLCCGATGVIFEGLPFYPEASRYWDVIDKYKVTKFYTAPTAIRALMKYGDSFVSRCNRSSLKTLGTVGEPINPEAWLWYYRVVGDKRCPIVDTYWQTETGGHVITPLPGCTPMKPGSATFPFFGVDAALLSEDGTEIDGPGEGYLVFRRAWPGIMRTVYGDHARFEATYFSRFPGYYCTGDGCRRDEDGYYWITGRIDDMMNVSGHLLSTAEIESALVEHPAVAEAAVVAHHHDVKGEIPYAFVTLKNGHDFTDDVVKELKLKVRTKIGAVAIPEIVQNAPALPKTRSGKIMRRILRKVATNDRDLGDVSTLAEASVVEQLYELRPSTFTATH